MTAAPPRSSREGGPVVRPGNGSMPADADDHAATSIGIGANKVSGYLHVWKKVHKAEWTKMRSGA